MSPKNFGFFFSHDVHRQSEITDTVHEFDWKEFFRCRTIDYRGEEVKNARSFSWVNIGPTLPSEIGLFNSGMSANRAVGIM